MLADIRQRVKLANNYVLAVARQIQRQADVEAVADASAPESSLADRPAQSEEAAVVASLADIEARPAIGADSAAVLLSAPQTLAGVATPGSGRSSSRP